MLPGKTQSATSRNSHQSGQEIENHFCTTQNEIEIEFHFDTPQNETEIKNYFGTPKMKLKIVSKFHEKPSRPLPGNPKVKSQGQTQHKTQKLKVGPYPQLPYFQGQIQKNADVSKIPRSRSNRYNPFHRFIDTTTTSSFLSRHARQSSVSLKSAVLQQCDVAYKRK